MSDITGRLDDDRHDDAGPATLRPQNTYLGTLGNDVWFGTSADELARGAGGDDELHGAAGRDELHGGADADLILGNAGDDVIYGGLGDDILDGNRDNDQVYGNGGFDHVEGGVGDDELHGGGLADQIFGNAGRDVVNGGIGADELHGGADDDAIYGTKGDDVAYGGTGDDEIHGGQGEDVLNGDDGADRMFGGLDDDVLDGGRGADVMAGGNGSDTFRFTQLDGMLDRITDYQPGNDRLDLAPLLPDLPEGYRLQDYVRFTQTDEGTVISIDQSGDGEGFVDLALLEGVALDTLPTAELNLPDALPTSSVVASSTGDGVEGNGASFLGSLSADGRYVTFSSASTNFVDGDDSGFDVFQKDLLTGEIVRISEAGSPGNGDSFRSAMSADGEVVAFDTWANNLDPSIEPDLHDGNGRPDVYVADLETGDVSLESIRLEGPGHWNQLATDPSMSADGTLVAFAADATADPAGTPNGDILSRIFVRDLEDGSLIEASVSEDGTQFANGASFRAEISANGEFVVFDSAADNLLTTADDNPFQDVYIKSLVDGSIRLVSADAEGHQGHDSMLNPTVSGDGRFVAFETAFGLDDGDTNGTWDVYLKDMQTGELRLVSESEDGVLGDGASHGASISDDGRYLAFRSAAGNLVEGDDNDGFDVFVKDLETGALQRFEVLDDGGGDFDLLEPFLAGDGHYVAYTDEVTSDADGSITGGQVTVASVDLDSLVTADAPVA